MSLGNLVGISLERVKPDPDMIRRLISAAERNLCDARVTSISPENRFDAAYKAIMQLSSAALLANGFRTLTSKPGHHMTMIQTLRQTIGLDMQSVIVLDALRKQRNVIDYSGDTVPEGAVVECVSRAELLFEHVKLWMAERWRPSWKRFCRNAVPSR